MFVSISFVFLSLHTFFPLSETSFVIAPPWANEHSNPCSRLSWQLLYWAKDRKCYQIFERGPCPESQELAFEDGDAVCKCPKGLLRWPLTNRCYEEYLRGPCGIHQYLVKSEDGTVQCEETQRCEHGWIFWPRRGKCYELYTQGPCHKGDLLIMNPSTAEPYCGCDSTLLSQYYFHSLKLCYEHYTRGPCEFGLVFAYNHTRDSTHCMCSSKLINYHAESQRCFEFGTKGACSRGEIFQYNELVGIGECTCKDKYLYWPANDACYREYTPGPCNPSTEFLSPAEEHEPGKFSRLLAFKGGKCIENPCARGYLYFPLQKECFKVGSRGPCPLGQLVIFEKYSGKSYKGECGCSSGYNQNYWPSTKKCYEWYTQGPCPSASFHFQFNKLLGKTECICKEGYIFWNKTNECYRLYSQGPCPLHAWLIPNNELVSPPSSNEDVFCECKAGYRFVASKYVCEAVTRGESLLKRRPSLPSHSVPKRRNLILG